MTKLTHSAPVIQVSDILRSRDFYRDALGFTENGLWGEPPCFCIMQRDRISVFLDQTDGNSPAPVNQYWAAYFYVSDANEIATEFKDRGTGIIRGPEDAPHGCREIDVQDPDGHVICFGQDLEAAEDTAGS